MDSSLAKGLKNQLFRELSEEIDIVIQRWSKYCINAKLASSRSKWGNFCNGMDAVLGPFLLAKYIGGSKRKPLLCMASFENENRQYNSWDENCISSKLNYLGHNPLWVESLPMGFSVSEHAIQRIFERSYTAESILNQDFQKVHFVRELLYAPLWSVFWTINAMTIFKRADANSIEIIIPSPNGLLLGEILKKFTLRCEIRTFVAQPQLSVQQLNLMQMMNGLSERYIDSIIPFSLHPHINQQPAYQAQLNDFFNQAKGVEDLLRTEHGISI